MDINLKKNEMHYHFAWLFGSVVSMVLSVFALISLNGLVGMFAIFSAICTGGYYLTKMIRLWIGKKD